VRPSSNNSPAGSYVEESPIRRPLLAPQASAVPPNILLQSNPASRSATPGIDIDIAGMQEEIDRAHERQADAARGTLLQIFPTVDREVIGWVLEANDGDLGRSIEALLEMSSG
jgi:Rab5 GDP/GTP exchange factor